MTYDDPYTQYNRALLSLSIEVDESVAHDILVKVQAYVLSLRQQLDTLRRERDELKAHADWRRNLYRR